MNVKELLLSATIILFCLYLTVGEALAVDSNNSNQDNKNNSEATIVFNNVLAENEEINLPQHSSYYRDIVRGYEHDINTYVRIVNGQFSFKTLDEVALKLTMYPSIYNNVTTSDVQQIGYMMSQLDPNDIESKNNIENEIAKVGNELYENNN